MSTGNRLRIGSLITLEQRVQLLGHSHSVEDLYRLISKSAWTRTRTIHTQMCSYALAWGMTGIAPSSLERTLLDQEMYEIAFRRY